MMFQRFTENVQIGLIIFAGMVAILLLIMRFTRSSPSIRQKIQGPLLLVFLLLTVYDFLFVSGSALPAMVEPYFRAVVYLSIAILSIRILILLFFDLFLVRSKKYRAPQLLKEITTVVLFTIVLLFVIQHTLRIQVTTLLATSALITVVLGLALQETLGNLFAGLALQLDQPYRQGDWIHVKDIFGRVEEVTWRATKLKTINNDYIIVPNGQIAKEVVTNHSFPEIPHATRLTFSTNYESSPNRITKVVHDAMAGVHNVIMDPLPEVRLISFADFSIVYEIKFFIRDFGLLEPTLSGVRKALWYHLRRSDIVFPLPIRNVFLHDSQEAKEKHQKSINHLADSLSKVYLFASLDREDLKAIAGSLVQLHYAEGEMIIREGEMDQSFFIIDRGQVEVYLLSGHGSKKVLTTLQTGDFFGEMALITGQKRTANVRAITDVRVQRLDKDSFKEVLATKPQILDAISSILVRRKDQLEVLMAESSGPHGMDQSLGIQDAKSRLVNRIRSYFGL